MSGKKIVTSEKLVRLKEKIMQIKDFWIKEEKPFDGVLISVHYNKIVAKSNRISGLFKGKDSNCAVVGAKFNESIDKHIITYFVSIEDLEKSIKSLYNANNVLVSAFDGSISKDVFEDDEKLKSVLFSDFKISKSLFKQIIADVSYIDDFEIEIAPKQYKQSIITLFNTETDTKKLLEELGIDILSTRILDNQTVF